MQNFQTSIDVINREHEASNFFVDSDKSDLWENSQSNEINR